MIFQDSTATVIHCTAHALTKKWLLHRQNRTANCRHVQLAFARTEKEEQKRSLADTRHDERILNETRDLQVSTLVKPSETVAWAKNSFHVGRCTTSRTNVAAR